MISRGNYIWKIRTENDLNVSGNAKHGTSPLIKVVECCLRQLEEVSYALMEEELCIEECAIVVIDHKKNNWKTEVSFYYPLWLEYVEVKGIGEGPPILEAVRMLDNESSVTYFVQTKIDAEVEEWLR